MEKRVILKLSGEGLANDEKKLSIDFELIKDIARQIKQLQKDGIQLGIVVGGGNFWRGASAEKNGIPRNRADYIGMLATVMNALALQSGFEEFGIETEVQSSISVDPRVARNYVNEQAINYLKQGKLVIFSGGTGRPYFTTDTAATLVASEIKADLVLMGKNGVSGIFDSDPAQNKDAKRYDVITYDEILSKNLKVMDSTAASIARDNSIELKVFNINEPDAIIRVIKDELTHTKVIK